jgi:hypothetical protein
MAYKPRRVEAVEAANVRPMRGQRTQIAIRIDERLGPRRIARRKRRARPTLA